LVVILQNTEDDDDDDDQARSQDFTLRRGHRNCEGGCTFSQKSWRPFFVALKNSALL